MGKFECRYCSKTLASPSNLAIHIRTHTGERPFECEVCKRRFTQSGILTNHKRTHTGERPFSCHICNKGFTQQGILQSHIRTHTGERPFKCQICKKGFANMGNLKIHVRTHTGERPYNCTLCGKDFRQIGSLHTHMKAHANNTIRSGTAEPKISSVKKKKSGPVQCHSCKRMFKQQSHLLRHVCPHEAVNRMFAKLYAGVDGKTPTPETAAGPPLNILPPFPHAQQMEPESQVPVFPNAFHVKQEPVCEEDGEECSGEVATKNNSTTEFYTTDFLDTRRADEVVAIANSVNTKNFINNQNPSADAAAGTSVCTEESSGKIVAVSVSDEYFASASTSCDPEARPRSLSGSEKSSQQEADIPNLDLANQLSSYPTKRRTVKPPGKIVVAATTVDTSARMERISVVPSEEGNTSNTPPSAAASISSGTSGSDLPSDLPPDQDDIVANFISQGKSQAILAALEKSNALFGCHHCGIYFNEVPLYKIHMALHSSDPWQCANCQRNLTDKYTFTMHLMMNCQYK